MGTIARAVSERGELVLRRRADRAIELRVNGAFVMDTLETGSETDLARAALALHAAPAHVLVGGLGLGFTVHEVLADRRVEQLHVIEIEADLIEWMRTGTVPHGPGYLADERLRLVNADIADAITQQPDGSVDVVLLDVDNGPGYLVYPANRRVYESPLLSRIDAILRPGGIVVIWSAAQAPELAQTMRAVFGNAQELRHEVRLGSRDTHYFLYLSTPDRGG